MAKEHRIIKVPVSDSVYKMVSFFFTDAVIVYSRKEAVSLTINAFLRKANVGEAYRPHRIQMPYIQVELSPENFKSKCGYMSKEVQAEMEDILLATFNTNTNLLIDKLMLAGWKQKKAVDYVYKILKMSEEKMKYDAILKRWQRYNEQETLRASKVKKRF